MTSAEIPGDAGPLFTLQQSGYGGIMSQHLHPDASRTTASQCLGCAVRDKAVCAALSDEEVVRLGREGRTIRLSRGQPLMWEGEDSGLVANVIDGVLKLSASTSDGREQIVGVVYPSDFIGHPFGSHRDLAVTAITDATICLFPRASFDRFASTHPALQRRLLGHMLDELDLTRRWLLLLGRRSATERVANFLIDLSQRLAVASCTPADARNRFDLPLTRQQIGDVLGLTIETVSRQLSALQTAGIIAVSGRRHVQIRDRARLETLAGR